MDPATPSRAQRVNSLSFGADKDSVAACDNSYALLQFFLKKKHASATTYQRVYMCVCHIIQQQQLVKLYECPKVEHFGIALSTYGAMYMTC